MTVPVTHNLCGGITVVAKYDGQPIGLPDNNDPMQYNAANNQFSALSSNQALQGQTKPYSLEATLTNWPPTDPLYPNSFKRVSSNFIEFDNPCDDPFSFAATAQDNIVDNFSGVEQFWELNPFTIDPPRCLIDYVCESVERVDGTTSEINCARLNFDGHFNSQPSTDGLIKFTATGTDYINNVYRPGQYRVTIKGTATNSLDSQTRTATFVIQLNDPCDTPTLINVPTLTLSLIHI